MDHIQLFKTFEDTTPNAAKLGGSAPFEFYGEQSDHIYTLRVNPSQELFDLDLGPDNGGVVTKRFNDLDSFRDDVQHLEDGAVYDWLRKSVDDTSWFYAQLVGI